jgi:hypothetical protein
MKEDILEQLVDDYLQTKGYFTRRNVKFKPRRGHEAWDSKKDSNHSDIDVIGFNPHLRGADRVMAVSCKSWQVGFHIRAKLDELENKKIRSGREVWKAFRELMEPKWTEGFFDAVEQHAGTVKFTYVTAVTAIKGGEKKLWEQHPRFLKAMRSNPIKIISFADMVTEVLAGLNTTLAPSDLARTLQLLKAAGIPLEDRASKIRTL